MIGEKITKEINDNKRELAKCISFAHHKGGTGKTTSCINIAGYLVKMGKKVLVIDLDPQGNATAGLGIDRRTVEYSVYDVLFGVKNMENVIIETASNINLAPSSLDLLAAEIQMSGVKNQTGILKENLRNIKKYYDYILIDVPPGSTMLMINGIVASDNIIIPLDSGIFAVEAMETLTTLLEDIREELKIETNIMLMLLRKCPPTTIFVRTPTKDVYNMLSDFLAINSVRIPKILTIPYSIKVYAAQMKGMPISHYAPYSDVGRAYKKITIEVLNYG